LTDLHATASSNCRPIFWPENTSNIQRIYRAVEETLVRACVFEGGCAAESGRG
jgi:hypothetical protein